jgi:hypothetical protein
MMGEWKSLENDKKRCFEVIAIESQEIDQARKNHPLKQYIPQSLSYPNIQGIDLKKKRSVPFQQSRTKSMFESFMNSTVVEGEPKKVVAKPKPKATNVVAKPKKVVEKTAKILNKKK